MPSGLALRRAGGRSESGMSCQQTGRTQRRMAAVPTEVLRPSLVAG